MGTDTTLTLLNIGLAIFAVGSAVAPMIGDVRNKEQRGFFKTLTQWGWLFLVCVGLTLVFGVSKEILSGQEGRKQQARNDRLQGTIDSQVKQIARLQSALNEANETIGDTRTKLVEAHRASQKTSDAIQAYVYNSLSSQNYSYLSVLGRMMGEATDSWLPRTEAEFFSGKAVNLICSKLNIEGEAPVIPKLPWYRYFQMETRQYEEALANLMGNHGAQMSPNLIRSISEVLTSFLLSYRWTSNVYLGPDWPPLLCPGRGLEKVIENSFLALKTLLKEVALGEKRFSLTPKINDRHYLRTLKGGTFRRGGNRFDQAAWINRREKKSDSPQSR